MQIQEGSASPNLILSASGRFNLDEMSLKHIGRQGLSAFWFPSEQGLSILQTGSSFFSGSHGRPVFIDLGAFSENFQCTRMKLGFGICQDIDNKLSNTEGRFELSRRT
jgi:hypothetical protein